ncbi:MAG: hypothetical protein GY875_01670 [Gammaproteobacteria bacterium]|nr:hypothetical protein [Gammaproteobacteria bacterium]
MGKEQAAEETTQEPQQSEAVAAEASDAALKHVRGLMYTLVTVCVFCASVLLGPAEQILPADGDLKIPIFDLEVKQGSFLYIGPSIIICLSMYTYLFLLNILVRMKAGCEYSDQYIFTMRNPAAQVATYCVFFWLPTLILLAFAFKALPRPESANLLATSLLFLIFVVSIQLIIRIYQFNFLGIIAVSIFCVGLVLIGFTKEHGWLETARQQLQTLRPRMALEKVNLEKRDLSGVEIRNAAAESISLKGANLRRAVIIDADLAHADLKDADLRNVYLECTDLRHANFNSANLERAKVLITNFGEAKFRGANLKHSRFYAEEATCAESDNNDLTSSNLTGANLEKADLTRALFVGVSFGATDFDGANLRRVKIIDSSVYASSFLKNFSQKTIMAKADLRCSRFGSSKMSGVDLQFAKLGGTDLTKVELDGANLRGAKFATLSCSDSCIDSYINDKKCLGNDIDIGIENMRNAHYMRETKLVRTELQFSNLKKSHLQGADLTNADLRGADLEGAKFSVATLLTGSNLLFANLTSVKGLDCKQLKKAKYWRASIRDQDLECGQKGLSFEKLEFGWGKAILKNDTQALSDFHTALIEFIRPFREKGLVEQKRIRDTMKGAVMSWVNLRRLNLNGIQLVEVELDNAILTGTKLEGASLKGANLTDANLRKADLRGANLINATMKNTKLRGADLDGARLDGVIGLECEELKLAKNWQRSYRNGKLVCKVPSPPKIKDFSNP